MCCFCYVNDLFTLSADLPSTHSVYVALFILLLLLVCCSEACYTCLQSVDVQAMQRFIVDYFGCTIKFKPSFMSSLWFINLIIINTRNSRINAL